MQIYLDDERKAPKGWTRTKTAPETIALLVKNEGKVRVLSLDHDLGDESKSKCGNGYQVLLWLEEKVATTDYKPPRVIKTHSANVSARQKMSLAVTAIENIYRSKHLPKVTETVPIEWIHVDDGLPIIPFNQFAISVLIITYDRMFAECSDYYGTAGWDVREATYGSTTDREGNKSRYFENSDKEFDFENLENIGDGTDWCPTCDPVVYWAYYPVMPKNLKFSKEVERHIAFNKYREEYEKELAGKTFFEMESEFNKVYNKKDV